MSIERLPENARSTPRTFEEVVRRENTKTKKAVKSFLNNAGIFIGTLITFVVVVVVTTDVRLATFDEISNLGIDFFLLLFCTYTMHITCADSGMRAGLNTASYIAVGEEYDTAKTTLISKGYQRFLYPFCRFFIDEELKSTRMNVIALVGLDYDQYRSNWMIADKSAIEKDARLSKAQKKAVKKANKIKPIVLLPEMFMRRGRNDASRSPLGTDPRLKKRVHFGVKFFTMIALSMSISVIAFEAVKEPSWSMFVGAFFKLVIVVFNGFTGYKYGYENIVIDSAEYIQDQTDLLTQTIKFAEENSTAVPST